VLHEVGPEAEGWSPTTQTCCELCLLLSLKKTFPFTQVKKNLSDRGRWANNLQQQKGCLNVASALDPLLGCFHCLRLVMPSGICGRGSRKGFAEYFTVCFCSFHVVSPQKVTLVKFFFLI